MPASRGQHGSANPDILSHRAQLHCSEETGAGPDGFCKPWNYRTYRGECGLAVVAFNRYTQAEACAACLDRIKPGGWEVLSTGGIAGQNHAGAQRMRTILQCAGKVCRGGNHRKRMAPKKAHLPRKSFGVDAQAVFAQNRKQTGDFARRILTTETAKLHIFDIDFTPVLRSDFER